MPSQLKALSESFEKNSMLVEQLLRANRNPSQKLSDHEYRVYSQWGEDGILSYLLDLLKPEDQRFIEFGVEDYTEANTRLILESRNWAGLVIDGNERHVDAIKSKSLHWRHRLVAISRFITAENINSIFEDEGFVGDIGLLSIDIDGVDYWVWKAMTVISPVVVVAEYNSLFGPDAKVTVPYQPDFVRRQAHASMIYYGASLNALVSLAATKGYCFVGSNSVGTNAFFVRKDKMRDPLKCLTSKDGFVPRSCRESRDASGKLAYHTFEEESAIVRNLPLVTVD